MNYILFDPPDIERFYPFTLTRPLGEMRLAGMTIKEYWEQKLGCKVSYLTRSHLSDLYPAVWGEKNALICSSLNFQFLESLGLSINDFHRYFIHYDSKSSNWNSSLSEKNVLNVELDSLYDQMVKLGLGDNCFHSLCDLTDLALDFSRHKSNLDCSKNIFFNDDDGPIYIEKNVVIMEGAMIRGPVYICEGSVIKMGAKIYGPCVIGPHCRIGGEVSNSIFLGYSNKSHEGFLGHAIIGEWCNIGAGTSNSNLRNDYGAVKMWDYTQNKFKDSGRQFLGLYMGDHSKCAINTSFNTGTTVGVNCNIFGSGFHRNYMPSFSWGGSQGIQKYDFDKAVVVARKVMARRNVKTTNKYIDMLRCVYDIVLTMR